MRTIHAAYRVSDLDRSLVFYAQLGYRQLGQVALEDGPRLAVLSFPDEPVATLELVHRPNAGPVDIGGFDHLAIQVDDLAATRGTLIDHGLDPSAVERPGGPRRPGSRTPTATGSSWSSGHPATRTASRRPTSLTRTKPEARLGKRSPHAPGAVGAGSAGGRGEKGQTWPARRWRATRTSAAGGPRSPREWSRAQ